MYVVVCLAVFILNKNSKKKIIIIQPIFYGQDARICKQHYTVNYQSEHHMLVEVYKDIETCVLRGYMVAQMAFMILGLRDRGKNIPQIHRSTISESSLENEVFFFSFF